MRRTYVRIAVALGTLAALWLAAGATHAQFF